MTTSLSSKIDSRDNNFTFLRLLASSFVIFAHSFDLLKHTEPLLFATGYMSFGTFAVYIFCTTSGFLVTKSWVNNPNIIIFLKKRFLRIYPPLSFCILLTAFGIGPLVTIMSLDKYFVNPWTWNYLINIFLFIEGIGPLDRLPGVFIYNPTPYVNGSLWFLPNIVFLYGILVVMGVFNLIKRRYVMILFLPFLLLLDLHFPNIFGINIGLLLKLSFFFFAGVIFYLYAEKIALNRKLCFLAMIFLLISIRSPIGLFVCFLSLPYLIIYFAFSEIGFIKRFAGMTDLSYGLFIYAFPLQQTLLHFFKNELKPLTFFILSWILTFIIAYLSWHLVEKHFLRKRAKTTLNDATNVL